MGCASSKDKRCRHCRRPYSPMSRSYSMHVHHPAQHSGDSYHVVALTSTTLGSIKLDAINQTNHCIDVAAAATTTTTTFNRILNGYDEKKGKGNGKLQVEEGKDKLMDAKSWSSMMSEKIPKIIPKTPIRTPPSEPETINAWELMEGLEDVSPFRSPTHQRSFSFDVCRTPADHPNPENGSAPPKPLWLQMADDDQNSNPDIPEFDPEIISTFRKSLQELPPEHPFYIPAPDCEKKSNGIIVSPGCEDRVIVYFTSLRGVRKTYEDCCHVRVILKSLGLRLDERDVSMHSRFKDELKELMGDGCNGGGLPRVFVGRKCIGGADDVRRMHEEGQLEKMVEGCEMVDDECGGNGGACEACGDIRFIPCNTCSGSCKIYLDSNDDNEDEEEEKEPEEEEPKEDKEEEQEEEGEYGFQRCPDCNENGLIRCPVCCE